MRPGSDDNPRMQIRFTKMQGAGNDLVVLDETQGGLGLTAAHYRYQNSSWLRRHIKRQRPFLA